jgi:pimeloyl-ACP methyl ester carboxylesterase
MAPRISYARQAMLGLILAGVAGCAAGRGSIEPRTACCGGSAGTVYAVDGPGNFQASSSALRDAIAAERLPLCVETFDWSHGYGRVFADEVDRAHSLEAGKRLACLITARRQAFPDAPIYVVGHSAGSGVVLAAAEALPPDAVDRILLLAPSVSADYDLRPALRTTRKTIDVFYSCRDQVYLGFGTALFGTADRRFGSDVAGRCGFHPVIQSPADARLYRKLWQHPWHPGLESVGNFGGHYGAYQPGYLKAYVLPLLAGS